ncbi:ubiquitin-like protein 3 [Colossoma macropomum]|uniref:ubiquitin-like protein 3 n=1 Tax=Colossoma macropomum TaxID=42526 RepID=UPI001863E9DE|nr:ubiquitin-like protein 3 [Colossoma macropomum]
MALPDTWVANPGIDHVTSQTMWLCLCAGWEEEQVSSPSILRLIFQGRFLHGNVTLGALKLPPGRTTVMHLVARETLPEPNSHGQRNREKTTESSCCLLL